MNTLEMARKLAALGEKAEAVKAYKLALNEVKDQDLSAELECAMHILQFGNDDDYKISYTCFIELYNQGFAQTDILQIMDAAFYQPNLKKLQKRYEKNCRLLAKYPYIFRQDFPVFDDLPVIFFPYDDNQYTPYFVEGQQFGEFFAPNNQIISRNFFKDLAKPILAANVFSQYELEYLHDNVRKSEWVARENHIYLHYTSWPVFCAYLQCLDLLPLLKDEKIVFLFEDEINQYPIDFKERFGIDYSQCEFEPLHIWEVNRLIWHTQLSAHNGGDFFNEIFDAHPNLLAMSSLFFDKTMETLKHSQHVLQKSKNLQEAQKHFDWKDKRLIKELYGIKKRSYKDILVAFCLYVKHNFSSILDEQSRIVPAVFFQPHFPIINYCLLTTEDGIALLESEQYNEIVQSPFFSAFKYIKTFTPMRRFTTSYGASVKFSYDKSKTEEDTIVEDLPFLYVLNRSFMINWQDRLFKDSRLVRFEDGKLNPRATFTALAAFLDLPYTESMTYCSLFGEKNPESLPGNDIGFSTAAVYRTYDDYANDSERAFIEYFLRDAYEYYGYDFKYYNGEKVDKKKVEEWIVNFNSIDNYRRESFERYFVKKIEKEMQNEPIEKDMSEAARAKLKKQMIELKLNEQMQTTKQNREHNIKTLLNVWHFVNKNGQPLHMMPKLELDPALLEQPLYH